MGSKSRKRQQDRSAEALYARAEKSLQKGNYRDALKEARRCFAEEPNDQHKRLLQFASVARAQELARFHLPDECRTVVESLLALGVTEPSVEAALPELYIYLGMLDRLRPQDASSPTAGSASPTSTVSDEVLFKIADRAVLRPKNTPPSLPEIRKGAEQVRAALTAITEGNEARAWELLRELPRQSPLADWKLFARGLAAYYRHDTEEMLASWDRLDTTRRAIRIAQVLKSIACHQPGEARDPAMEAKVQRLLRATKGTRLVQQLTAVQRLFQEQESRRAVTEFSKIRNEIKQLDPQLLDRTLIAIGDELVRSEDLEGLGQLARSTPGPSLDPLWHRTRALLMEADDAEADDVVAEWKKYLRDLPQVTAFTADERSTAEALVYRQMARACISAVHAARHCPCGDSHEDVIDEFESEAETFFKNCIERLPRHADAYRDMAEMYDDADESKKAAAVYRRLLEHQPQDMEAIGYLVKHYLERDEGIAARDFALRARAHRPLDRELAQLTAECHAAAAREHGLRGELDAAREQFASAESLTVEPHRRLRILTKKAMFETKRGHHVGARELIDEVISQLEEPTVVWLWLALDALQYGLSEEVGLYEKRWLDAMRGKCRGGTAALLCRTFQSETTSRAVEWLDDQWRPLMRYLSRCGRVAWDKDDLLFICEFLEDEEDHHQVLFKLSKQGRKQFPDHPLFHMNVGVHEFRKGPVECNRRLARKCFQTVIALAKASPTGEFQKIAAMAADHLHSLATTPTLAGFKAASNEDFTGAAGKLKEFIDLLRKLGMNPKDFFREMK